MAQAPVLHATIHADCDAAKAYIEEIAPSVESGQVTEREVMDEVARRLSVRIEVKQ